METTFKDKRGREWEAFCDMSYFNMICVRLVEDGDFKSACSFHFITQKEASEFIELLKLAY